MNAFWRMITSIDGVDDSLVVRDDARENTASRHIEDQFATLEKALKTKQFLWIHDDGLIFFNQGLLSFQHHKTHTTQGQKIAGRNAFVPPTFSCDDRG